MRTIRRCYFTASGGENFLGRNLLIKVGRLGGARELR